MKTKNSGANALKVIEGIALSKAKPSGVSSLRVINLTSVNKHNKVKSKGVKHD
jgi:hypothetical protein